MENKFTTEEYNEIVSVMSTITHFIPEHLMGRVWGWYRIIGGHNNNQPCSCQSSAKYWVEAVNTIQNYIRTKNGETKEVV